jgi:hypothetical protein
MSLLLLVICGFNSRQLLTILTLLLFLNSHAAADALVHHCTDYFHCDRNITALLLLLQRTQMRRLFAKFDESRAKWSAAVQCLSHLDALLSLAAVSAEAGFCRPVFSDVTATAATASDGDSNAGVSPFLKFTAARHPCLAQTYQVRLVLLPKRKVEVCCMSVALFEH